MNNDYGIKAVFLDRDGVLNDLVYYADYREWESPRTAADLTLRPGAIEALRALQAAGWALIVVSNQPSYAKGKTTLEALHGVHDALQAQLEAAGVELMAAYYSYHHPNGIVPEYTGPSIFRKPNPGFLLEASDCFNVNLNVSWMVGDSDTDIECGQQVGCHTALIAYARNASKQGGSTPDLRFDDLAAFAGWLTSRTADPKARPSNG